MSLSKREAKKRQMVRTGYVGVGIGAVLLLLAATGAGIIFWILGAIILVVSGWATRAMRSL
jgi:hypothetical protein